MTLKTDQTLLVQQLLHRLGEIVHQVQRERGYASLFLDSEGLLFKRRFSAQVNLVDETFSEAMSFTKKEKVEEALSNNVYRRLKAILDQSVALMGLRKDVCELSIRYAQAVNVYTFSIVIPLLDLMTEIAQKEAAHCSDAVSAYSNFIQWKERLGMERALGARGFHSLSFKNQDFRDRFSSLIAEQRNYFNIFETMAPEQFLTSLATALDSDDLETFNNFNKQIDGLEAQSDVDQFSSETWFTLLTRLIDGLRAVEQEIVDGLSDREASSSDDMPETGAIAEVVAANSQLEKYKTFLKTLPVFSTLDSHEFEELLSFAQIREYEKDKILFLKEEPTARLYIILDGWVKVFNGLETGEEAILQMLGMGETLLESSVFLNTPAPINAQVVETALLLSIPAPVIRQRILTNPKLALNMLNTVSLRSQRLVHQIEFSRLKTAHERVGWFLLRLALSQKSQDGKIRLPYEKSIIASYLDMRPETFSRTLQKFKQEGFEIASDHVTRPEKQSLCKYCDSELADQCSLSHTPECPHADVDFMPLLSGT